MARMPSKYPHGGRDAHSVERAERAARPRRPSIAKERRRILVRASGVAGSLIHAAKLLRARPDKLFDGKWHDGDKLIVRILAGDPVADIDALTEAIESLTVLRDRLSILRGITPGGQC